MTVLCTECGEPEVEGCDGSGWVTTADRVASPCPSWRRKVVAGNLARADIPELYATASFEAFVTEGLRGSAQLQAATVACRSYCERFPQVGSLLFTGRHGAGKTYLLAALLAEIIRRHAVWGRFVDFTALLGRIQATFDAPRDAEDRETEAGLLDPLLRAPILLLDELGARRLTPFAEDTLYLLVNGRYSARLPTLFTSNYPMEGKGSLETRIGARIVSRLWEMCPGGIFPFDRQDDFRRRLAKGLTAASATSYTQQ